MKSQTFHIQLKKKRPGMQRSKKIPPMMNRKFNKYECFSLLFTSLQKIIKCLKESYNICKRGLCKNDSGDAVRRQEH